MNLKYLVILSLLIIQGCDEEPSDNDNQEYINLIQENEKIWKDSGVSSYTFTYYSSLSDCPTIDPFPPVEITVVDDSITSIYVPEFDQFQEVENSNYRTIDQIFTSMHGSASSFISAPIFDAYYGYPISYRTDASSAECDANSVGINSLIVQ